VERIPYVVGIDVRKEGLWDSGEMLAMVYERSDGTHQYVTLDRTQVYGILVRSLRRVGEELYAVGDMLVGEIVDCFWDAVDHAWDRRLGRALARVIGCV